MQQTQETQIRSLDHEGPLEEGMGTHSSILALRISRTEEPERLQSIGSQRIILLVTLKCGAKYFNPFFHQYQELTL